MRKLISLFSLCLLTACGSAQTEYFVSCNEALSDPLYNPPNELKASSKILYQNLNVCTCSQENKIPPQLANNPSFIAQINSEITACEERLINTHTSVDVDVISTDPMYSVCSISLQACQNDK